jgi:hypothetical protein
MVRDGKFMVSVAKVGQKTILRPVICNPAIDTESLNGFIEEMIRIASTIN